jgi:NADH-quinone oxidoreductase subunit L
MVVSGLISLAGIVTAWSMYGRSSDLPARLARQFSRAYELSRGKFWFDELYSGWIVRPTLVAAELSRFLDNWVVDGLVRASAALPGFLGRILLRPMQNGLVQYYALAMICGMVVLVLALWLGR